LKYEEVYLKDYADVWDAEKSIADYFRFYNNRRIHQALDYKTPGEVYFGGVEDGKLEPQIGNPHYLNLGSQWS
jgi:putative transposase